jgi:hypothetical protein
MSGDLHRNVIVLTVIAQGFPLRLELPARPHGSESRMTGTEPVKVTVVTAEACHFCDDARAALAELADAYPLAIHVVPAGSGEGQALLHAHGAGMFPLVLVDGAFFSAGRLPRRKLARMLSRRVPAAVGAR